MAWWVCCWSKWPGAVRQAIHDNRFIYYIHSFNWQWIKVFSITQWILLVYLKFENMKEYGCFVWSFLFLNIWSSLDNLRSLLCMWCIIYTYLILKTHYFHRVFNWGAQLQFLKNIYTLLYKVSSMRLYPCIMLCVDLWNTCSFLFVCDWTHVEERWWSCLRTWGEICCPHRKRLFNHHLSAQRFPGTQLWPIWAIYVIK
jgi:hypothetical protein